MTCQRIAPRAPSVPSTILRSSICRLLQSKSRGAIASRLSLYVDLCERLGSVRAVAGRAYCACNTRRHHTVCALGYGPAHTNEKRSVATASSWYLLFLFLKALSIIASGTGRAPSSLTNPV